MATVSRLALAVASSSTPGLTLRLHRVAPETSSRRAVLLLHGATLCSFGFDLMPPAISWQHRLADRGWATYALDARSFGASTPPAALPALLDDRPFSHAAEGEADVADWVRVMREQQGHELVTLIGFSWGTMLAGRYASAHPESIDALVQYAPIYKDHNESWLRRLCADDDRRRFNPRFGAWRWTTAQALTARWDGDIPISDKRAWRDPQVLQAVLAASLAADPLSASRDPPAFRAPNGPFEYMFNAYSMRAVYDASKIVAPVLIVRGNADSTSSECDARGLLRSLGSRNKRYETVSPGSHFVCFERACSQLLDVCEDFLEECSRERLGDDSSRSGS